MYTFEELKTINPSYDHQHTLTISDLEKVNDYILHIESSRSKSTPGTGDIVQYTNRYGEYRANAHIETLKEEGLYINEKPYTPFASIKGSKFVASASGGPYHFIPTSLKYVGKQKKPFVLWGHNGPCGNGAVTFLAEVSVWEYTEGNHEFTTKDFDKFTVHVRDDLEADYRYCITKGASSYVAFKTKEEYQAWLNTFHGQERDGHWYQSKTIWTYKQTFECVPIDVYLISAYTYIDSELNNGCIQECKRIVKGTTIHTIMPYQQDKIVLNGEKRFMHSHRSGQLFKELAF